ncbi:glycosyltransferase involved in cell wall bisynthesis [Jatrophihabitans sp. GAS493]|uniref:glycosyltransferase family 4 protein n=1 Tax=Jatrophihabitans sp. GAS493 TaxID=1907575 RepID=UPI000BB730A4|nr:glycosyltransferase family 4 protein [Jatrophihabitans sp. GAS493]SOD70302.1 glycosyltransferase involved in cell wall bisynthesis [Jatrophihabitans sp. GAS493]
MTPQRERISFLSPDYPRFPGGGALVYYTQASHLARLGYDVSVIQPLHLRAAYPGRAVDLLRGKVRDVRAGSIRRRIGWITPDPRVRTIFLDRLDESSDLPPADLRIATYWRTSEILGARDFDGAQNLQFMQAYETWGGPVDRVDATWRLPFHTAVVSETLMRKGREFGIPDERLHLVPNGLDHELCRPAAPVEGRGPCVAFLVHEAAVKGLADTIAVAERIRAARPDATFIGFGGRRAPAELPEWVEYVRRPVGRELVEKVYSRAAVFLCGSHSEGWGLTSIEAMSCGAALVSTRNGGVDDFATDDVSALLRDVGDIAGLSDAVLELLADEPRRLSLVEKGLQRAGEQASWYESGEIFHQVVRTALDSPVAR